MIKEKLKKYNVKLGDFALELEISRPTLNNFIKLYDNGEKISNEKYQIIFDELFSEDVEDEKEFKVLLSKFHKLIDRDKKEGIFECNASITDLITKIYKDMKEDGKKKGCNENIYSFVNLLINNYREEELFNKFINYFLYLNGSINKEFIKEDEKPFLSHFYKLIKHEKEQQLMLDEEYYFKFISRIDEMQTKKRVIEEQISEAIKKEIEKKINEGSSIENLDHEGIIKKIESNISKLL